MKCLRCLELPMGGDPNYPGLCAACAWRDWMKSADPEGYWDKVECVECALDRDCEKHPAATPEVSKGVKEE